VAHGINLDGRSSARVDDADVWIVLARPHAPARRTPTIALPSRWLVLVGVTGWALVLRRVAELALR